MRRQELSTYAGALGISLEDAELRIARDRHERAMARLVAKGWHA